MYVIFRKVGTEIFAVLPHIRARTDNRKCAIYQTHYKSLVYMDAQKIMQKSAPVSEPEYRNLLTEMEHRFGQIKIRARLVAKDAQIGRRRTQKFVYTNLG